MNFYLMCGAPFSGKSTLARAIALHIGGQVLSLDTIMRERHPDIARTIPVEEWEKVHQIALAQMEELAAVGTSIVLDDTSFLRFLRERFRQKAEALGYDYHVVYMDVPTPLLEARRTEARRTHSRTDLEDTPFYNVIQHMEVPTAEGGKRTNFIR